MVLVTNHHPHRRFSRSETLRVVRSVLLKESKKLSSISVVFVDSRFIRGVNMRFLGHDSVTDVISFPLGDGLGIDGEVYVNLDRAKTQARDYEVSYRDEVLRLVIHGTLHLLGYDDSTERNKKEMSRREDYYLSRLT